MTTNFQQFNKICSYISPNFREHFGNMPFKKGSKLYATKLSKNMNDTEIMSEIGPAKVSLGDVYATLESLDHSTCAIFYCRDKDDVLWAVSAYWCGDGWHLHASSVGGPDVWFADRQVFSHRFSVAKTPQTLKNSDTLNLVLGKLTAVETVLNEIKKQLS